MAWAQTRGVNGWALNRFDPSPAGETFFAAEHPWYTGASRDFAIRGGIVVDYANAPLVLRRGTQDASTIATTVVQHMLVGHAQLGIALFDRIGIHLSMPVSLLQDGTNETVTGLGPSPVVAAGDPRIGVRVRLFGEADQDAISLHLGAQLHLGANLFDVSRAYNTTDGGLRVRANLTLAGRGGPVRWSLSGGFHFRSQDLRVLNTSLGNDIYATAGVGFVALEDRLTIGPEAFVSTIVNEAFSWKHFNAEVLLGAHYLIADTILVGAGAGPGLTQGAGTPTLRAMFHLAYAPSLRAAAEVSGPVDGDGDGIADDDDACPTVPQGDHPDTARAGCPLNDSDGDGVFDNEDACVTEAMGEHPDADRRGCPTGDADGDGVFDNEDACRDTAAGEHADPERRGCPDGDADRDGVFDHDDQCRDVAQGPFPDSARRGCPLPDRDGDTVPDATDHCPDQAGVPTNDPATNGCPQSGTSIDHGTIRIRPVYFATNRDVILPRSLPVLRSVAAALTAATYIRRVQVEGHTDDVGDDAANLDLSNRRAQSVVRWLTEHGIDGARLVAQGFGETRPIRPIEGLRGAPLTAARSENRRVMFVIIDPPQSAEQNPSSGTGAAAH